MRSWTRTLNLDDAHTLLALAEPGRTLDDWSEACHDALPALSASRRRELVRLLRDGFIDWTPDGRMSFGLFLEVYSTAPAVAPLELRAEQWALSHPRSESRDIPLADVDALVEEYLATRSTESLRKTRTVLLGAMEGIGTITARGTGQHRSLAARQAFPHPVTYGFLVRRELIERGVTSMPRGEVTSHSLALRLTQCGRDHAEACLKKNLESGTLTLDGDQITA